MHQQTKDGHGYGLLDMWLLYFGGNKVCKQILSQHFLSCVGSVAIFRSFELTSTGLSVCNTYGAFTCIAVDGFVSYFVDC